MPRKNECKDHEFHFLQVQSVGSSTGSQRTLTRATGSQWTLTGATGKRRTTAIQPTFGPFKIPSKVLETDGRSVRPISPAVPKMRPLLIDIQEKDTSDDEPPRKRLYSTPQLSPSARPYWEKRNYDDIGWRKTPTTTRGSFNITQHHKTSTRDIHQQTSRDQPRPSDG